MQTIPVVIIDDKDYWIDKIKNAINSKDNFNIVSFKKYNEALKEIIHDKNIKIYFIDIELIYSTKSGYDIANEIRTSDDWNSIIIFCSVYNLKETIMSKRLNALTYICKFDDFEANVQETYKLAVKIINQKHFIKLKECNIEHNINLSDILYVEKENKTKYCIVAFKKSTIRVRKTLKYFQEETKIKKFKNYLLVNEENVFCKTNKEIVFKNGRKYKIH